MKHAFTNRLWDCLSAALSNYAYGAISCLIVASTFLIAAEPSAMKIDFAIALHGGAGIRPANLTEEELKVRRDGLAAALELGRKILAGGGTALDAVEQTVRALEDNPLFNAGKGAVFNREGIHELDASIMDGLTGQGGAVTGITTVKNPISLARLVMTETPHVLLAFDGAEKFADAMRGKPQIERVPNSYFSTEARRKHWQEALEREKQEGAKKNEKGTVGCVARDKHGNLAAATSTGGLVNKMAGRIGDTPILGAGNYANNATCAVSGTGTGEYFMRSNAAFHVSALMNYKGLSLDEAVQYVVEKVLPPDTGGLIAVDHDGRISMHMNTIGMSRAATDSTGKVEIKFGK
jgi:beta-aspartyl-peptidase (threonine type)